MSHESYFFNKFSFYNLLIIVNHATYLLAKSKFVTLESISSLLSWMSFLDTMNLSFHICMWVQCVHDLFMSMCVSVNAHMPQHGDHLTPQEPCSLTSTLVKADCLLFTPVCQTSSFTSTHVCLLSNYRDISSLQTQATYHTGFTGIPGI